MLARTLPQRGPSVYRIRTIEVPIAGSATARVAGLSYKFRWPKPVIVTGMYIAATQVIGGKVTSNDAVNSKIEFSILDQESIEFTTDGFQARTLPAQMIVGPGRRWLPLNKKVFNLDVWTIQAFNASKVAETTLTPMLALEFVDDPQE